MQSTPSFFDNACIQTRDYVVEPEVIAVRNNNSSPIEHRIAVIEHKKHIIDVYKDVQDLLNDDQITGQNKIILKKAQQIIQFENKKLAALTQSQFCRVSSQLEEIQTAIEQIKAREKKVKANKVLLPLRDPILSNIFFTMINAQMISTRAQEILPFAQFKIALVVLYVSGARVNEIKYLTKDDFINLPKTKRLPIQQTKTHQARFAYLGPEAIQLFKLIEQEIELVFDVYKLDYLAGSFKDKKGVMIETSWIRSINRTIETLQNLYNIDLVLTSHSVRSSFILFKLNY